MVTAFNRNEKMALIAILRYIISADGIITRSEISQLNEVAEEKGFEDYQEIFREVDNNVKSEDDIKVLIGEITSAKNARDILKYALDLSRIDANINPQEAEIIQFMCDKWNIDFAKLME